MSDQCSWGGCVRKSGHAGAHTATPPITTREWDQREEKSVKYLERKMVETVELLLLDFPIPPWGDLLDEEN